MAPPDDKRRSGRGGPTSNPRSRIPSNNSKSRSRTPINLTDSRGRTAARTRTSRSSTSHGGMSSNSISLREGIPPKHSSSRGTSNPNNTRSGTPLNPSNSQSGNPSHLSSPCGGTSSNPSNPRCGTPSNHVDSHAGTSRSGTPLNHSNSLCAISSNPRNSRESSSSPEMVSVPVPGELASLFDCLVCYELVLPPIFQCQNGHLVCSNCRPKLLSCPTCRGHLGNIRNLALEKVGSTVTFPCKYQASGCTYSCNLLDIAEHDESCKYRTYNCPCPGTSCMWTGTLNKVLPHLLKSHKSITSLRGQFIVFWVSDINFPGAANWLMLQTYFDHHFMLVLEKGEKYEGHQQFFAIVQMIGTRKQAENFVYRLELASLTRTLTWEATPKSLHEGVATAILNSDCLVFDTSIAQLFSEDGNLCINVLISRA